MLRLGCFLWFVLVVSGCGYKTDLTLPDEAQLAQPLVMAQAMRLSEYRIE